MLYKKHEIILEHLKQIPVYRGPYIQENISNVSKTYASTGNQQTDGPTNPLIFYFESV